MGIACRGWCLAVAHNLYSSQAIPISDGPSHMRTIHAFCGDDTLTLLDAPRHQEMWHERQEMWQ